jgi:hypothetical protein
LILAFGEALLAVREGLVPIPVVGDVPERGLVMAAHLEVWTPAGWGSWWPWRPGG